MPIENFKTAEQSADPNPEQTAQLQDQENQETGHPKNPEDADANLKAEQVAKLIEWIKSNSWWQEKIIDGYWNKKTEEEKEQLYEKGQIGVWSALSGPYGVFSDFEARAVRPLVHFGILPAPEKFAGDEIEKGFEDDREAAEKILTMLKLLAKTVAPETLPIIEMTEKTLEVGTENLRSNLAETEKTQDEQNQPEESLK